MEIKDLTAILVVAMVGCVLVAGFIPVVGESVSATTTFKNDGLYRAVELTSESEHTLVFDYTNPDILTIDDYAINMKSLNSPYASMSVAFSDDWFVRYVIDTGVILYKCGTSSASAIKGATVTSQISMTLTISAGVALFTYSDESTYTYNVDGDGLIISDKGSYSMKSASEKAYVNKDSVVYGIGRTDRALGTSGTSFNAMIMASVEDGVTPIAYSPQYTWNDNRTVNAVENTRYTDLYELSGFTFNLVDNDSIEHALTYNQIFVPYEITSEKVIHADDNTASIVSMIPFILIMGVVLMFVGVVLVRRYV